MDGKQEAPKYVVTVLRDMAPITVVEHQRMGDNMAEVDVLYPDVSHLEEALAAVEATRQALGFMVWKQTGVLPAPPDMEFTKQEGEVSDDEDFPF